MEDRRDSTRDILGIVDKLVNTIEKTNEAHTEALILVNSSIIKISNYEPKIEELSEKVDIVINNNIDPDELKTILDEVRNISTNLKIIVSIIGVIITFAVITFSVFQSRMEDNIIKQTSIEHHKMLDEHIELIKENTRLLEDIKRQK